MKKLLVLSLLSLTILPGCKKNNKEDFDRTAMLTDMANLVIIPAYTSLNSSLILLDTRTSEFITSPSSTTLAALRAQYLLANKDFQACSMYDFGPAKNKTIKPTFNTFPCDTAKIEANVATASYDLTSSTNYTAIGFPTLDYLLYYGTESEIIEKFTTAPGAANRKSYLAALTLKMKTDFTEIPPTWNGSSKESFIAQASTEFGSSTSLLINEVAIDLEILKNARIGIPNGEQTGGSTFPEMVEGYYSGNSITFAKNHLAGIKTWFTGGTGIGFDEYIRHVENNKTDPSLADNILSQIEVCNAKMDALSGLLSDNVTTNNAAVHALYVDIQRLLVFIKTDMTSLLGVLVTYQDNDGD